MFIEDAKVKERVYSGNTVIFLLPYRECTRENSFFWSPSQLLTLIFKHPSNSYKIKLYGRCTVFLNVYSGRLI